MTGSRVLTVVALSKWSVGGKRRYTIPVLCCDCVETVLAGPLIKVTRPLVTVPGTGPQRRGRNVLSALCVSS